CREWGPRQRRGGLFHVPALAFTRLDHILCSATTGFFHRENVAFATCRVDTATIARDVRRASGRSVVRQGQRRTCPLRASRMAVACSNLNAALPVTASAPETKRGSRGLRSCGAGHVATIVVAVTSAPSNASHSATMTGCELAGTTKL